MAVWLSVTEKASTVIASEAKQSSVVGKTLDCFVASLLAMTKAIEVFSSP
jgi:hypothetical protein